MKSKSASMILLATLGVTLGWSLDSWSQPPGRGRGNPGERQGARGPRGGPGLNEPNAGSSGALGNQPGPSPIVRVLDADGDGVISASEIQNATKTLLTLDRNGDGNLSLDEYRPLPPLGGPGDRSGRGLRQGIGRGFIQLDTNRNGKLDRNEMPPRIVQLLDRVDSNGDGTIDRDEFEKAREIIGERGGRRGMPDLPGDNGGGGIVPKRPTE